MPATGQNESQNADAQTLRVGVDRLSRVLRRATQSIVASQRVGQLVRTANDRLSAIEVSHAELSRRLQDGARQLQAQFLGKEEIIRLLFISAVAGEHLVMVGPPGTAKSALLRAFAQIIDRSVFLLTSGLNSGF